MFYYNLTCNMQSLNVFISSPLPIAKGHSCTFLDALASLDFKLSVTESVSDVFTASASTGLSDFFYDFSKGWEDEGYSNQ